MLAVLPPELWRDILEYAAIDARDKSWDRTDREVYDWANLWIVCRQVCRIWRADITSIYLDMFVRDRCVLTCGGTTEPPKLNTKFDPTKRSGTASRFALAQAGGRSDAGVNMYFDRLAARDPGKCVFKVSSQNTQRKHKTIAKRQVMTHPE
jgi:hypothetical protein